MSSRRQAIFNVGSNWVTLILSAIVSLFLAPFIVAHIGSEAYGAWALIGSLVGYMGLVDLGVRAAVTKYVATLHAAADHDEAGLVTSAGLLFFCAAGLIVAAIGIGLGTFVDRIFEIPPELVSAARVAIYLTGFTVGISVVGGVCGGVIAAMQRFDHLNVVEIALTLGRAAAIVVALGYDGGLVELATIQLAASSIRTVVFALDVPLLYPELRVHLRGAWSRVPKVFSFGVVTSVLHVSSSVINYSDSIIIGIFMPLEFVAFFAVASTLILHARGIVAGISQPLAPMVGSLEGRGEMARVGEVMLTSARFATLAIGPVVAAFVVSGETFIGLWMGDEFAKPAGGVLRILAPALWVFAGFQICSSAMIGIGRHGGMVPAFVLEALANVILCVALVQLVGITGVAVGILLPRLAISLGFGPWYVRKVLGTPITAYWRQAILRPALAVLPFAVCCGVVDGLYPADGLLLFFAQIAALLPLAGIGAWVFALDLPEREFAASALERGWRLLQTGADR